MNTLPVSSIRGSTAAFRILRVGVMLGGTFLTLLMLLSLLVNAGMMSAYSPLTSRERLAFGIMAGIYGIPFFTAVLAAMNPCRRFVGTAGRILVYAISPVAAIWIFVRGGVGAGSEEVYWISAYIICAICCWEALLVHAGRQASSGTSW